MSILDILCFIHNSFKSLNIFSPIFSLSKIYSDEIKGPPINRISLINGHIIDKYEVFISKEKVEIDSIVKNYTDVIFNKIFRYPENTFNFTCWTDSTDKNLCTDYLNILFNELSLVEYEFSGEGIIPYPYYSSTSSGHYVAVLKYEKESDFIEKTGVYHANILITVASKSAADSVYTTFYNNIDNFAPFVSSPLFRIDAHGTLT